MRILPYAAVFTFVAGVVLLAVGWRYAPAEVPAAPVTVTGFDIRSTPTPTATASPTQAPSPTPTPTPFDGKIQRMVAPSLGIDHAIEEIGLLPNNQLDTPHDGVNNVGWYYIYDKPGWGGNAVFSAHVYYHSKPAPFVNLAKSQPGDIVQVVMEDGTTYRYEVFSNTRYHRDTIPMGEIIDPPQKPDYDEWITLITCGGELDATGLEYLSRDVVVAKRIWE